MDKTDEGRVHELCALIAAEKDRARFLELVRELSRILRPKEDGDEEERDSEQK